MQKDTKAGVTMCGRDYVDDKFVKEIEKLISWADDIIKEKEAGIHLCEKNIHPSEVA